MKALNMYVEFQIFQPFFKHHLSKLQATFLAPSYGLKFRDHA